MPYQYLEDIAIADAAFEASGENLQEVFISAANAVMNLMVENMEAIAKDTSVEIAVEDANMDLLLFKFLDELIYHKDAHQLLLRIESLRIAETANGFLLRAETWGEVIDPQKHHLNVDVKAITLHEFSLKQTGNKWIAHVHLDI